MTSGTPDWQTTVGKAETPLPATTTAPIAITTSFEATAGTGYSWEAITNPIAVAYNCYLAKLIVSIKDATTINHYIMRDEDTENILVRGYYQQSADVDLMGQKTGRTKIYMTNIDPASQHTIDITLLYYRVPK